MRNVYEPSIPPQTADVAESVRWMQRELQRLSAVVNGGVPRFVLEPQAVAPDKPREGMMVNADGANWDPGAGAGIYQYLGGAWVAL